MDLNLDNSALSTLSCRRKFQLTVLEGLVSPLPDKTLDFGNAIHKALENLDNGMDLEATLAANTIDVDPFKLRKVLTLFNATVKLPPPITINNKPAVEVKFKYHYGKILADSKSIDVNLLGTIDRIFIRNDRLIILDYKTASDVSEDQRSKKRQSYELAFQLPFYVYALLKSGILPAEYEALIKERKYNTCIFFIFHNTNPPKYVPHYFPAYPDYFLYQEIPAIINTKVEQALQVAKLKNEPAPHDGMTVYKACDYCAFRPACMHMGEAREIEYLDRFNKRSYDPLSFR